MKTATVRELRNQFASIAAWLEAGETVLLTRRGRTVGRIVPEPAPPRQRSGARQARFARRFAPLPETPRRDFSAILEENRGSS